LIHRIIDIDFTSEKFIFYKNLGKGDRLEISEEGPVIATVEKYKTPRYPTLRRTVGAKKNIINEKKLLNFNFSHSLDYFAKVDFQRAKIRPKKIFTPGPELSANERMKMILSGGLKDKNPKVAAFSSPKIMASTIFNYLKENKYI
jgi:electron transfer flavoprotein alpha/beta subunit